MNTLTLTRDAETLLKPVCTHPDELHIRVIEDHNVFAVVLRPHQHDIARIIGSGGGNFTAMKTILQYCAEFAGTQITYMVNDGNSSPPARRKITDANPHWDPHDAIQAAATAIRMAGFSATIKTSERPTGRKVLSPMDKNRPFPLPVTFGTALARWIHVIARSQGGNVDFEFDPA